MSDTDGIAEILVLHHSHADVGYTHLQAAWWELSRRFLDEALDLCERSAEWGELSRVRWSCEVTGPVIDWLRHRPSKQIDRFAALCRSGQMAVGAFPYHLTSLVDGDELALGLRNVRRLREEFGLPVKAAIQHDVNGIPLAANQLLRDANVELLVTAINQYCGGVPFPRPALANWVGPDGGALLSFSGEIYQSFNRVAKPELGDLDLMARGLADYCAALRSRHYPHDFVMLTATYLGFSDNNPPSPLMADAVRRWNAEDRAPAIRFVSVDEFAGRMAAIPDSQIPHYAGDWTEWWAFGLGAAPREVRQNQRTKIRLRTTELLQSVAGSASPLVAQAWEKVMRYDEHTSASANSVYQPAVVETVAQRTWKECLAYDGLALSSLALRDTLENVVGNPVQGRGVNGVFVVNASPVAREETVVVAREWMDGSWTHINSKVAQLDYRLSGPRIGPVKIGAWSCRWLPRAQWSDAPLSAVGCATGSGWIESDYYRLEFDRATGQITSLHDKSRRSEMLDATSEWAAFDLVHESVNLTGLVGNPKFRGRDAIYNPDWSRIFAGESVWQPDWPAQRQSPCKACEVVVSCEADAVVLTRRYPVGCSVRDLVIEVRLLAAQAAVEVSLRFHKEDVHTPEGLYLAVPLNLRQWRAWWDSADVPVELDAGQLPSACRDFVPAGRWIAVASGAGCVTMACPDMPLAQVGGFTFARERVKVDRDNNCLLLAWLMNNYWDTNYNVSQPGPQEFRYRLTTTAQFDATAATEFGLATGSPLEVHPIVGNCPDREVPLAITEGVVLLSVRPAAEGPGIVVRLLNPRSEPVTGRVRIPDRNRAWVASPLEERRDELRVRAGWFELPLNSGSIATVMLE